MREEKESLNQKRSLTFMDLKSQTYTDWERGIATEVYIETGYAHIAGKSGYDDDFDYPDDYGEDPHDL